MDWDCRPGLGRGTSGLTLVAVESPRQEDAVKARPGSSPWPVEPTEAAITERITLALIEAVANDLLAAGDPGRGGLFRLRGRGPRLDHRGPAGRAPRTALLARPPGAGDLGPAGDAQGGRRRRRRDRPRGPRGKAVGSLIVVGDARNVLARTRALGFDPFKGYRRKERNVRDGRVREAIKEIAQMDGAFVVARDGTVEAACRIVDAPNAGLTLPKGLGTRHWAAAAITKVTAVPGRRRQPVHRHRPPLPGRRDPPEDRPMRHARAMKWHDTETEPVRGDKG